MRPRTENQFTSDGTLGGVLNFILEASEACSGGEIRYQLLFFFIVSPLAVLFRVSYLPLPYKLTAALQTYRRFLWYYPP